MGEHSIPSSGNKSACGASPSVNLEPASEFLSFSSIELLFSRNLTLINNSHSDAVYLETTCIKTQSTPDTSTSLPNPKLNSTYEPQEQLPVTNLYSCNPFMQNGFHQYNIPTRSMPIALFVQGQCPLYKILQQVFCTNHFQALTLFLSILQQSPPPLFHIMSYSH